MFMTSNLWLLLCVFLWGTTTFLQRLSADHMNPIVMQIVVALGFLLYVPFGIWHVGGWSNIKWSGLSICLTLVATIMSIVGNIVFYNVLRTSNSTGAMSMLLCLYPVWTLILSATFLHETFSVNKIVGIIAMIVGTVFLSLK
jgi:drug/metabolite transporter (DMT)-like permease